MLNPIYERNKQQKFFEIIRRLVYAEFSADWFTAYYNSVARHVGTKPFRPITDIPLHWMSRYKTISPPQTFCYSEVKVHPEKFRPYTFPGPFRLAVISAYFTLLKDIRHQTILDPIHFDTMTFRYLLAG